MNKTFLKKTTILTSVALLTFASLSYASPQKAGVAKNVAVAGGNVMTTQPLTPAQQAKVAIDNGDVMTTQPLTPKQQVRDNANSAGIGFSEENTKNFIEQESGQVTTQPVEQPTARDAANKLHKAAHVKEAASSSAAKAKRRTVGAGKPVTTQTTTSSGNDIVTFEK